MQRIWRKHPGQKSVLMLIKTRGLWYDDRVRKEALTLLGMGMDVRVVALEDANQRYAGIVHDRISVRTVRLRSRTWLPSGKGLVAKVLELCGRFLVEILRAEPDVVWIHNLELAGLIPVVRVLRTAGKVSRLVWDQHELPADRLLRSRAFRVLFAWLLSACDCIVMASEERKQLVAGLLGDHLRFSVEVLQNYPDQHFLEAPVAELPAEVESWLDGHSYVLAQGGASPGRGLFQLVEAVLGVERLKLVVVGPYSSRTLDELRGCHGTDFANRVLFTGMVPQMDVLPYIDHALASAVLYEPTNYNALLCAPNRLYQAIARGTPVLVSPNPPMAAFVQSHGCGVVVSGERIRACGLRAALREVMVRSTELRRNALRCRSGLAWETQLSTLKRIVSIKGEV